MSCGKIDALVDVGGQGGLDESDVAVLKFDVSIQQPLASRL